MINAGVTTWHPGPCVKSPAMSLRKIWKHLQPWGIDVFCTSFQFCKARLRSAAKPLSFSGLIQKTTRNSKMQFLRNSRKTNRCVKNSSYPKRQVHQQKGKKSPRTARSEHFPSTDIFFSSAWWDPSDPLGTGWWDLHGKRPTPFVTPFGCSWNKSMKPTKISKLQKWFNCFG